MHAEVPAAAKRGEVVSYIQEGLGNQLFQYAMGRALALRNQRQFKLDTRHYIESRQGKTKRRYDLDRFNIQASPLKIWPDRARLAINNSPKWGRALPLVRKFAPPLLYAYYRDAHAGYDPAVTAVRSRRIYLSGYWQSEKYFADAAATIRSELTFKDRPSEENRAMIELIRSKEAPVMLHVRRGDYVNDRIFNGMTGAKGLLYYTAAVSAIRAIVPRAHFFIFSNDIEWTRAHLPFAQPCTFVAHNTGANDWEDLRLMTHCRHHILANSSFSWWGAWLSAAADRRVIAPEIWFFNGSGANKDIVASGWTTLSLEGKVVSDSLAPPVHDDGRSAAIEVSIPE